MGAIYRGDNGAWQEQPRRRLVNIAALALGIAVFGAVGSTGALAEEDDGAVTAAGGGTVVADDLIDAILADVFASVFGAGTAEDTGDVPAGDVNVGGNVGGSITMGGSSGGGFSIGGGSGGSGVESGG